jgi:asparagine synthase (glutamine-hydrolysing)
MVADVPVGIFLSGGFDSSLVASVVQQSSSIPLKSFTIGFEEGNNEAPYAKATAKYLGTDHTEYFCKEKEATDIIYDLPFIFDEPFADSSAIPTILVSKLAVKEVKVALSADAGDEVFIGYNRYTTLLKNQKQVGDIPSALRKPLSALINAGNYFIPNDKMFLKHRLDVISNSLADEKRNDAINLLDGAISSPPRLLKKLLKSYQKDFTNPYGNGEFNSILNPYDSALAYDYRLYLQNDILTKVDKAAMSVSLEGREPLLDHRIAEFATQLPTNYKYDGKTTKKILKDIVYDYLPSEMMERPKSGFSVPINKWLKSSLSGLIDEVINYDDIRKQGILNADFVEEMVKQFKANNFFYELLIWEVIQFQMWYNRWMK